MKNEIFVLFLFLFINLLNFTEAINGIDKILENTLPFNMTEGIKNSEAMRLFKIRAQGILPQINRKGRSNNNKKETNKNTTEISKLKTKEASSEESKNEQKNLFMKQKSNGQFSLSP
ncbi:MAG: hypothetical protein MJ252_13200 [archaeon]|nr:hypothetical protein [archaeon]